MPYIQAEARAPYQEAAKTLFAELDQQQWPQQFSTFVIDLTTLIYGDASNTRYFKQNELIGVLTCMLLEWHHRTGAALTIEKSEKLTRGKSPESIDTILAEVAERISSADDANRPGNLNYFLTLCMLEAVAKKWVAALDVPKLMLALTRTIYETITREYETVAIKKNGEVFPEDLLQ